MHLLTSRRAHGATNNFKPPHRYNTFLLRSQHIGLINANQTSTFWIFLAAHVAYAFTRERVMSLSMNCPFALIFFDMIGYAWVCVFGQIAFGLQWVCVSVVFGACNMYAQHILNLNQINYSLNKFYIFFYSLHTFAL